MRLAIYCASIVTICCAQRDRNYYTDVDSGAYVPTDEGRYIHDDSGRYIPDYSGLYQDDGTGRYANDNSGRYQDQIEAYRNSGINGNYASATSVSSRFARPDANTLPSTTRFGKYDDTRWRIIRLLSDVNSDGFHWEYETENEISGEENAKISNKGTDQELIRAQGFYQYTGPDNIIYNLKYTADENGFIPKGDHLPPALQRALAQQISSGNF